MSTNPMQMMQFLKGMKNPQQAVIRMLEGQAQSNPMYANLLSYAKTGNSQAIESTVRDIAAAKGVDFDKEFSAFKKTWGL